MKKKIFIVFIVLGLTGTSQNVTDYFEAADAFFKTYVKDGKVAYSKIYKHPEMLNDLLGMAAGIKVVANDAKTYQAFWINSYNLAVIKGIIDHYPTQSPLDHPGFFDKKTYHLGGKQVTLNTIENDLLRAKFNDARFHFVLVCGALGCPPLIDKAYFPKTLEAQLDTQTKFALNGMFLKVNPKKKRVEVSQIMEWYKGDFTMNGMTEIEFINKYRTAQIPSNFKLNYFPYNWKLNDQ